jgi:hypothetical protein
MWGYTIYQMHPFDANGQFTGHLPGVDRIHPPAPILTPEEAEATAEVADQQRRFYAALTHIATKACTLTPETEALEAEQSRTREALDAHFFPRKDIPTKEDAFNRIWLAGTMGAINRHLAGCATDVIQPWFTGVSPQLGPAGNYVVPERGILAYPEGSAEDLHMNMTVHALTSAAQRISLQRPSDRYEPVFKLEEKLRLALPPESPPGAKQTRDELSCDPLNYERVRISAAQFMRNIMHGTILLTKDQPRELDHLNNRVRCGVGALEIAATYPQEVQRILMGIPGEPYESLRQKRGITPGVIWVDKELRFKGMIKPAPNGTMCSGSGAHSVLKDHRTFYGETGPLSAIYMYAMLSTKIAPFTLFQDARRPYDPEVTITSLINDGLHIAGMTNFSNFRVGA